jgi:ribonuclease-3
LVEDAWRAGSAGYHKSALQELVQSQNAPLPEYRLVGTLGPDHRKLFQVEVVLSGEAVAEATGTSKKEAEQEAARLALEHLRSTM